jgi:cobalamin synthase
MTFARGYSHTPLARPRVRLLPLVYLVVGAIVASTHHYFQNVHSARAIGSAVLAVSAWPLLFLGINLHIHP